MAGAVVHLKDFARPVDIVTRYGGEEFVIVLPDTNKNGAIIFAERLLDAIGKHSFGPEGKSVKLKTSIGISNFPEDGRDAVTASGLIDSADKALLKAKDVSEVQEFIIDFREKFSMANEFEIIPILAAGYFNLFPYY